MSNKQTREHRRALRNVAYRLRMVYQMTPEEYAADLKHDTSFKSGNMLAAEQLEGMREIAKQLTMHLETTGLLEPQA